MKHLSIIITLIAVITACQSGPKGPPGTRKVTQEGDFGEREVFFVDKDSGEQHGPYLRYSATDTLLEEARFVDGTLQGERKLYYPNGTIQIVEHYEGGLFHGLYQTYYPNGTLKLEGEYVNNKMEGIWKGYYETGELFEEVTFEDNLENGPFTEYFKSGVVEVKGTYLDGDNEDGELLFYDEEGELIKSMNCDRGLCRTTWTAASGEPQR